MQINPPFDGSPPCPMCNQDIRGASAYVHNFLVRWGNSAKAYMKLFDLARFGLIPEDLVIEHPAVQELVEVIKLLKEAASGITEDADHMRIRWAPEVTEKIAALVPRAKKAMFDTQPICDAHFADARHASGDENILRERQGSVGIDFLPKYEYHYTVEIVDYKDADLIHNACNTGLQIHEHFKENIRKDPTFYGKVFCPKCTMNLSVKQFTMPFLFKEGKADPYLQTR